MIRHEHERDAQADGARDSEPPGGPTFLRRPSRPIIEEPLVAPFNQKQIRKILFTVWIVHHKVLSPPKESPLLNGCAVRSHTSTLDLPPDRLDLDYPGVQRVDQVRGGHASDRFADAVAV